MEPEPEKPWRRNAPNDLIVNSILAAISAIVVQTAVTSGEPKYSIGWLIAAFASLLLFIISAERAGEAIREESFSAYIWSMICYNFGVLFLFMSLCAIFSRYVGLSVILAVLIIAPIGIWFWGLDTSFLMLRDKHYVKWKRKMDGEVVEGEILDHRDIIFSWIGDLLNRITRRRH
jgi:hypothetical protein